MSSEPVQWLPAILALAIGAAAGLVMLIRASRGRPSALKGADLALRDAEAERDALFAQLREWDEPGRALSAENAREKAAVETRAASALQAIDRMTARTRAARNEPESGGDPPRARATANAWIGFAAGLGTVAVIAAVGFLALGSSEERAVAAPVAQAAAIPAPSENLPDLSPLESAVTADPENLELRLELTRQLLLRDRLMEVYAHTEHILRSHPDQPRALSYQALVRLAMGNSEESLAMLDRALVRDPDLLDAYVHKALVFATTHRHEEAAAVMAEASRRYPDQKVQLEALLGEMSHGH